MKQPSPGVGIPDVARSYVLCAEDQIISPERRRAFAAPLGVAPIEIAPEHAVFAVKPQELVCVLDSLAR